MSNYGQPPPNYGNPVYGNQSSPAPGSNPYQSAVFQPPQQQQGNPYQTSTPTYGPGAPQQPVYGPGAPQQTSYGSGVPQYGGGPQQPQKSSNSVGQMYKQAVSTGKPMFNKFSKTISSKLSGKEKTQAPDHLQSYQSYQGYQNPYQSQTFNPQAQQPIYGTPAPGQSVQSNLGQGQPTPQQQLQASHSQHGSVSSQQAGVTTSPQTPASGHRVSMSGPPQPQQQQNPSPTPSQPHPFNHTPPPQQYGGAPITPIQPNQTNHQQLTPLQQLQQHQMQQQSPVPSQGHSFHPNQPQQQQSPTQQIPGSTQPPQHHGAPPTLPVHPSHPPQQPQQQSSTQQNTGFTQPPQHHGAPPTLPVHPSHPPQQPPQQYGNVSPLMSPSLPVSPDQPPSETPQSQNAGNQQQQLQTTQPTQSQSAQQPQQLQQAQSPSPPPGQGNQKAISETQPEFVAELPGDIGNLSLSNNAQSPQPANEPQSSYQAYQPPTSQSPSATHGFAIPRRAVSTSSIPLAEPWRIADPMTELPTREFYMIADLVFDALDRKYEPRNTGLIEASKVLASWKCQQLPDAVANLFAFNSYTAFARLWSLEGIPHMMVPCQENLTPKWDFQEQVHGPDMKVPLEFPAAAAPYPSYMPALNRAGWYKSFFLEAVAEPGTLDRMVNMFCSDTYKPGVFQHPDLQKQDRTENAGLAERARSVRTVLQRVCQEIAAAMQGGPGAQADTPHVAPIQAGGQ